MTHIIQNRHWRLLSSIVKFALCQNIGQFGLMAVVFRTMPGVTICIVCDGVLCVMNMSLAELYSIASFSDF